MCEFLCVDNCLGNFGGVFSKEKQDFLVMPQKTGWLLSMILEGHRRDSNWSELALSGQNWHRVGSDWPELAPSGTELPQNGQNWPVVAHLARIDTEWQRVGSDWSKVAQIGTD